MLLSGFKRWPKRLDLRAKRFDIAGVFKHVVGAGGLFGVGDLVGEPRAGIGFGGLAMPAPEAAMRAT